MNKNFFLTLTAIAVMTTIGYAAYNNGSITDLSNVINGKAEKLTLSGSEYLGAVVSTQKLATTTTKAAGTKEIRPGSLSVSVSSKLNRQYMVVGSNGFKLAEYIFDAKGSGEDINATSMKVRFTGTNNTADQMQNCQLFYDDSMPLATGGNSVNPTNGVSTADDLVFNFDNVLRISKGGKRTVILKCDVKGTVDSEATSGTSTFSFGISNATSSVAAIGLLSNKSPTIKINRSNGIPMTLKLGGGFSIVLDSSSPRSSNIKCGQYDVPVTKIKISASFEDVVLKFLRFRLNGTVSTDAILKYSLTERGNLIGEGVFGTVFNDNGTVVSEYRTASTTLSQSITIPRDSQKIITVNAHLRPDNPILPCQVGKTIGIDYDGYFEAVGLTSGTSIISSPDSRRTSARRHTLVK